jgi:N-methylhydantoinase A
MWRVGVDVGGTFTDLFAWNEETNETRTAKVLTVRGDRSQGVLGAVQESGILFDEISFLIHGTTTATNALIERSYPDAALVTTEGFRDVLEIGRMHRQHLYRPYQTKPKPLIRRRYRYTVNERVTSDGEVFRPLDEKVAREVAERIAATAIRSIAVCFINSYVNSRHEQRMREILLERMPTAQVVCSGELRPVFREHGRFTTAAIAACIMPVMHSYFDQLEVQLKDKGFKGRFLVLKSNGGMMSAALARFHPEELIESGPAGGVAYAAHLSGVTGFANILHTDVGGTSFDTSIVQDGQALITRQYELEWDLPVTVPMLDIHSVGAGGGSVAWVDEGGSLRVGPRSAGSDPGPACYGRGSLLPTVTDANFLLGRLEPTLSGKFTLDKEAAEAAIEPVARAMGMSLLNAAEGIVAINCETMAHAVKATMTARGRDPRDFVLASFGGAGPMHACFVAKALSIPHVVVPTYAGVASAFGATVMNIRHDLEAFHHTTLAAADPARITAAFDGLEAQGRRLLLDDGIEAGQIRFTRSAQMRYQGQTYEVTVGLPEGVLDAPTLGRLMQSFHDVHRVEYGVASDEFQPEIVSLSVTAIGLMPRLSEAPPIARKSSDDALDVRHRRVRFDGQWIETPVYDGAALPAGASIAGPAVVEYDHAIAILPPESSGRVDGHFNLVITVG